MNIPAPPLPVVVIDPFMLIVLLVPAGAEFANNHKPVELSPVVVISPFCVITLPLPSVSPALHKPKPAVRFPVMVVFPLIVTLLLSAKVVMSAPKEFSPLINKLPFIVIVLPT